jgi:hypothetical protein
MPAGLKASYTYHGKIEIIFVVGLEGKDKYDIINKYSKMSAPQQTEC